MYIPVVIYLSARGLCSGQIESIHSAVMITQKFRSKSKKQYFLKKEEENERKIKIFYNDFRWSTKQAICLKLSGTRSKKKNNPFVICVLNAFIKFKIMNKLIHSHSDTRRFERKKWNFVFLFCNWIGIDLLRNCSVEALQWTRSINLTGSELSYESWSGWITWGYVKIIIFSSLRKTWIVLTDVVVETIHRHQHHLRPTSHQTPHRADNDIWMIVLCL